MRSTACLKFGLVALLPSLLLATTALAADPAHPLQFTVSLSASAPAPQSGRLLVFAQPWDEARAANKGADPTEVDTSPMAPEAVYVAAKETPRIAPGQSVGLNADEIAFPGPFSSLKPGTYAVQAVLDVHHSYNYGGRRADDPVSGVVKLEIGGTAPLPVIELQAPGRAADDWAIPSYMVTPALTKALEAAAPAIHRLDFTSPALSAFWGRPVQMRGIVLTPPGYDPRGKTRYPTVYWTHGFGGALPFFAPTAARFYGDMASGKTPPMIYVFLDESLPTGTHEFADSVNNGPWGQALTAELIPSLEKEYRMDAKAGGRFLTGHSSGGWATLWLQTRYPKLFGGTWSTSPDSSDFHDFTGVDIYGASANAYRKPDGSATPLVRDKGKLIASFEQYTRLEEVQGGYGGQIASFDWVFSPRGADGRPVPMFDRQTGAVNPAVVPYWRDNYDIAWRVARDWKSLKPDLDGKIHLYVGTADTFYLDGPAHRLQAVLDGLGAKSEFRYIDGRTHFDLFKVGDDRRALEKDIAWSMWKTARPASTLAAKP
jgi:S-formylglutathione hydrolase FrmB